MYSAMFLILSVVGLPNNNCPFGAVCANGYRSADATITLTMNIMSTHQGSYEMTQIDKDVPGIYRLSLEEIQTGIVDASFEKKSFLILDDFNMLGSQGMKIAFLGTDQISIKVPQMVALLDWPTDMSDKQVVASYRKDRRYVAQR